jgi:hypothetical protein
MKFAVALTLATTAMAGIVARSAGDDVKEIISTAGKDIDAVKSAADAYKGDKTDLVSAADKLVSDLKAGKTKVDGGDKLTAEDAINLTGPVGDLADKGSALTTALKERKPDVEKAGECKTVQDQIAAISSASNGLIESVVSKVPEAAQAIAKSLAGKLTTVLQQAESDYKDCTNSGGSGGSSTGSATGTATPTGTGSATGTATPTGTGSATATHSNGATTTSCPPSATGTGGVKPTSSQVTVPTGAAALYAPAGVLAAVAAALAL